MKTPGRCIKVLACVLICGDAAYVLAANMRSFIESVRRKALVVYVGSVKEVRVLQRTKFEIKAKAVVDIKAVVRTPGSNPKQASIQVMMRKRRCWRAVLNTNCDPVPR